MQNSISFENLLKSLEEIVKKLESGECSLEESLELYKKGAELCGECSKILDNAKLTIKTLTDAEDEANG